MTDQAARWWDHIDAEHDTYDSSREQSPEWYQNGSMTVHTVTACPYA